MAKYRKKPVVVEAYELYGEEHIPDWLEEALMNGTAFQTEFDGMIIKTLEGDHYARKGDFIIRGVHGELYPCKPDIFRETYEYVGEGEKVW